MRAKSPSYRRNYVLDVVYVLRYVYIYIYVYKTKTPPILFCFTIIHHFLIILYSVIIVVQKCPFEAIQIINLPKDLDKDTTHRYGPNTFKLHRLPVPRPGQVLGLVGTNGIGKSTALKVLAGKLKPNLGRFNVTL